MSVRKVVTRRSCHFRGYFPSLKNGKPTPWESQLEGGFFRLLELSPQVLSYTIQPSRESVSLDSATIKYFPDLHVFLTDGREWWFEVKPQKRLLIASIDQRLEAAKAHFAASNRNFTVVTNDLICGFHAIRPFIPHTSGHLFHAHPARQSERSDAGSHC
jgi:hypothetical protein